jgi:lipid-binding SYLF domain-containing protein
MSCHYLAPKGDPMQMRHENTGLILRLFALLVAVGMLSGCSTSPKTEAGRENLHDDAAVTLRTMKRADPGLDEFLDQAHGYAVFPSVGKGGLIAGGAYGKGEVYEDGQWIGYADLSQATIGAQAGGQEFSELIVFQTKDALERFKSNKLHFAANASAVALKSGTAKSARYDNGVAVFVRPTGGLMVEAAIGGQSFSFSPKE